MKLWQILCIGLGALVALGVTGLITIGSIGPDTYVYLGQQLPKRYLEEVKSLGLVADDEKIRYFYSDALFDIKEGLYFVTDRNLVLYCQDWDQPDTIIPFAAIADIKAEYDDSFLEDSYVYVATHDDLEVSFPLSSERGRDKMFVEYLTEQAGKYGYAGGQAPAATE